MEDKCFHVKLKLVYNVSIKHRKQTFALKLYAYSMVYTVTNAGIAVLGRPWGVTGAITSTETDAARGTAGSPWTPASPAAVDYYINI